MHLKTIGIVVAGGMAAFFVTATVGAIGSGDLKMAAELGQTAGVFLAAMLAVPPIARLAENRRVTSMSVGELKQLGPDTKKTRARVERWARSCLHEATVLWHGEEGEQDDALGTQAGTIDFQPLLRERATRAEAQIRRRDGMLEMGGVSGGGRGAGEPLAIDEVYEALRRYHEK